MTQGSITKEAESYNVTFDRRFSAPIERVWAALTEPAQLSAWLASATVTPGVGGRIELRLGADEQDASGHCRGTILVWNPPHALEYEWNFPGEDATVVRWDLSEQGTGTRLRLTERRLGPDQALQYGPGWHAHLDGLGAFLEHRAIDNLRARFAAARPLYRLPDDPVNK